MNINGSMTCSAKTLTTRMQPANDVIAASVGVPVNLAALNVNCAQPDGNVQVTVSGGSAVTLVDDGTSSDQAAGDGIYSGQWTPPSVGSYTLTFPGGDIVQAEVLNSYVVAPTNYNYISIAGTSLNLADDGTAQITSPFAVPFGGGNFTKLQVGANGTISFTDAYSSIFNTLIPSQTSVPVTLVAPFWQDLYPVQGSTQNVYWAVVGSAPDRQLVIEWRNVRSFLCHNDSAATVVFEVVFSENSSDILFEYADTTFGDYCYFQDAGSRAAVGVQVAPTVGTMWTYNDPVLVSGSALLWTIGNTTPPNNPVPNITSLSPSSAPINGPAFALTVNGTGFVPTSSVTFNLYEQPPFTSDMEMEHSPPSRRSPSIPVAADIGFRVYGLGTSTVTANSTYSPGSTSTWFRSKRMMCTNFLATGMERSRPQSWSSRISRILPSWT